MEHFEELKHSGQLPTPAGVGMQILVLTQNEDCSMDEIVRAIQVDPALTGKIVKLASSVQASGSLTVSTVKEAAMRLGTRTVSNVALGFTLVSGNRSGRCRAFDYDGYWSRSLATAVAAQVIARELKLAEPVEAFTCGLLVRIGELALATLHPTEYAGVLERWQRGSQADLSHLERESFRIDHKELAQALLEDWGLPKHYAQVAGAFDPDLAPEPLGCDTADLFLRIIRGAASIADVCLSDEERQPYRLEGLRDVCASLGVGAAGFCKLFDKVAPEWRDWGRVLKVPTRSVTSFAELEDRAGRLGVAGAKESAFGSGLRILAVDDDPVSLRLLVQHLLRAGHYVLTATDGREALAVTLEQNPQIVVTDWVMPEMDGLELCKALRRNGDCRNIYVLILTGRAEEDRIVEAFDAGVDDYVTKPFNSRVLLARIRGGQRVVQLQEKVEQRNRELLELYNKEARQARKERHAAMTDSLTELYNRRYAMKRLEMDWANSTRSGQPYSVIMMDIDRFKHVNDTCGHAVGDQVLVATARAIKDGLRRGDVCARIGGEEFLVLCPNTDGAGAALVAERIRRNVRETVRYGEDATPVTVSLGVAMRTPDLPSFEVLLKLADEAVYRAKADHDKVVVAGRPGEARDSA